MRLGFYDGRKGGRPKTRHRALAGNEKERRETERLSLAPLASRKHRESAYAPLSEARALNPTFCSLIQEVEREEDDQGGRVPEEDLPKAWESNLQCLER